MNAIEYVWNDLKSQAKKQQTLHWSQDIITKLLSNKKKKQKQTNKQKT